MTRRFNKSKSLGRKELEDELENENKQNNFGRKNVILDHATHIIVCGMYAVAILFFVLTVTILIDALLNGDSGFIKYIVQKGFEYGWIMLGSYGLHVGFRGEK